MSDAGAVLKKGTAKLSGTAGEGCFEDGGMYLEDMLSPMADEHL